MMPKWRGKVRCESILPFKGKNLTRGNYGETASEEENVYDHKRQEMKTRNSKDQPSFLNAKMLFNVQNGE